MAKRISDEELRLSIVIDGNPAQKQLIDIEKATRELKNSNKDLLQEKKKLERQNKQDTEEYKKVTAEIRDNNRVIADNKAKMAELQNQIGLTGLTLSQLRQKANQLKLVLKDLIPGSDDYKRYEADLAKVNGRLADLRNNTDQASNSLNTMSTEGRKVISFFTMLLTAIAGVVVSFQKFIDINGVLADAQSDVQKTTGLTTKEVNELTKSFGVMKTRTARTELLKLAEEGGRLGVKGVKNIQDYLDVANQLNVALKDDLTKTQITEVGKMTEQYRVAAETGRDFGGAMLSLGSAINEVSQDGSNQAGYLVEFLKRTVGVSTQVKLSAADNLGYAATFDEIGQSSEVTGTMMNKVWMDMTKNTSTYAKIAGVSVKDFSKLLSEDANAAMLKFLEGLKGSDEGFREMIVKMDELDEGGARGAQALSALSNNIDKVRARQETANIAMQEATSLTNEYNIKNENLAALYEKIRNTIESWMTADVLVEWLYTTVEWFAKLIGATEDTDGKVAKFRDGLVLLAKVFAVVFAAMVTNVAWQKLVFLWTNRNTEATLLYNIAQKAKAVADGIATVATQAYAMVLMLLRGNLIGATQAFRAMTAAMMTTPIGALLVLLSALTTAYLLFKDTVDNAAFAQNELNKIQSKVKTSISEEREQVNLLLKIARDETASKEARLKAIKKLNDISPEYLGNLTLEEIGTNKVTAAIERYIQKRTQQLKVDALEQSMRDSYRRQSDAESKDSSEYSKWYDYIFNTGDGAQEKKAQGRKDEIISKEKTLQQEIQKELEELYKDAPDLIIPDDPKTPTTPTGTPDKKYVKEKEKRLDTLKEYKKEQLALEREIEDSILANMDSNFNQERQKLDTEYTRRLEDLQNRMIKEVEIEKSIKASKNTALTKEERNFHALQAEHWKNQNAHLQNLQLATDEAYHNKKKALTYKYSKNTADELNAQFESEKVQREIAYNNELEIIGNNDKQKKKLTKEFQKEERDAQQKHLEELLNLYTDMLSGANIDGIDYSLLSPESEKKLKEDIEKVELAVSKLKAAKAGEDTEGKEKDLGLGGQADILGFSTDQWESFFENIDNGTIGIQTMTMAVQALQNVWTQYDQLVSAQENKRLKQYEKNTNDRQRRLKRQLDVGIIDQDQYNQANQALEADLDRKKAEIEYKQAKRKRAMDVASVMTNTALAIMNIWAKTDSIWAAPYLTAMVGGLGAIQLATIMRQPLPMKGFEEGLYGDYVRREQDGKIFKAGYGGDTKSGVVNKPTYYLAGENGPEMIIDNAAFRQMNPELRDSLIRELRTIKGFEGGYYNQEAMQVEIPRGGGSSDAAMLGILIRIEKILDSLDKNGVIAYMSNKNMKNMKNMQEGLDKLKQIKENSKI